MHADTIGIVGFLAELKPDRRDHDSLAGNIYLFASKDAQEGVNQ